MEWPWIFQLAFILGLNPSSNLFSRPTFHILVITISAYILSVASYSLYYCVTLDINSFVILAILLRTCVTLYFIVVGSWYSSTAFYEAVIMEIAQAEYQKLHTLSTFSLVLSGLLLSESVVMSHNSVLETVFHISCASLNIVIHEVTMAQFSLCCFSVRSTYRRLKGSILGLSPHTGARTVRKLRERQLDILRSIKNINHFLGVATLLYVMTTLGLMIQKVDLIIADVVHNHYNSFFITAAFTFFVHLVALWFYCFSARTATKMHEDALYTLLDLPTRDMDVAAIEEIVLLAEELHYRPTLFSAGGCFYIGFHAFYSVIGIVFSYLMIVGPLAFHDNYSKMFS